MELNWMVIIANGLMPLLTGFIWYNPKVMGTVWANESGLDESKMKEANMALIFGLTALFGVMLSLMLTAVVIHQTHYFSVFANNPEIKDPASALGKAAQEFMSNYGGNFRTFKHGAFHGALSGLFLVLPVVGINALFERRSRRYILIHTAYWTLTLALMGGVLSAFA